MVLVADWRFLQGPQQSAVEEMQALADRGLRVAIMHIESLRPMARRRYALCGAIQRLVNAGRIDQVLPGDAERRGPGDRAARRGAAVRPGRGMRAAAPARC